MRNTSKLGFFVRIEAVNPSRAVMRSTGAALLASCLATSTVLAQAIPERSLALDAEIDPEGKYLQFSWSKATGKRVQGTRIQRRQLGESGHHSWQFIEKLPQIARIYRDDTIEPGIAYEYRISRPSSEKIESGHWTGGVQVPAQESRGIALLVVDQTLAQALSLHLERFALDLIGDGWSVVRHEVPRHDDKDPLANLNNAKRLRSWVQENYTAAPKVQHALILVGQVPVVKSGRAQPDGHAPQPLESDLYYADVDGNWRENGAGGFLDNVIPSDHIEMQVGRIDFSNMDDTFATEISLLKHYFDKNHHWRHAHLGDLREAYGQNKTLFVEKDALRNIVGPANITSGGHHDSGTRKAWLFGVDFGSWKPGEYVGKAPTRAVFTLNFGSSKLYFSKWNNQMKALLSQPWYALSTGWGARPAWQLHHMAMGKSIGYSHMRTANNGAASKSGYLSLEYTSTGMYQWVNPVWVNLLGDPTLHAFPLSPVRDLRARRVDDAVFLEWEKSSEPNTRYRIYRALKRFGPYEPISSSALVDENRFIDRKPIENAWYMVRAHALKKVYAGSFYRYSQGRFARVDNSLPKAGNQSISAPKGETVEIRLAASDADISDRLLLAPVKGPLEGRLQANGDRWSFVPDPAFNGRITIPFTVFDGIASDQGSVTIDVQ